MVYTIHKGVSGPILPRRYTTAKGSRLHLSAAALSLPAANKLPHIGRQNYALYTTAPLAALLIALLLLHTISEPASPMAPSPQPATPSPSSPAVQTASNTITDNNQPQSHDQAAANQQPGHSSGWTPSWWSVASHPSPAATSSISTDGGKGGDTAPVAPATESAPPATTTIQEQASDSSTDHCTTSSAMPSDTTSQPDDNAAPAQDTAVTAPIIPVSVDIQTPELKPL